LEFHLAALLATNVFLDPIVGGLHAALSAIFGVVHNYGWSLIILAGLVKLAFWPLNTMQFKSMLKMQRLAPQLKALQKRYGNDREKLNESTMALYKDNGANPLSGCAPMLVQMPILLSLYWAVISDKALFASQSWLWIGTAFASASPRHVLASSLAAPDYVLLVCYMVSMYFSVRFTSPAVDPQQAQQQKIMAFMSPMMIGFFGFKYAWPSALLIYWLAYNVFTMAQQMYLIRKYHTNPAAAGPHPEAAATPLPAGPAGGARSLTTSVAAADGSATAKPGGSRAARRRRSSRR
jgi:YidC/Oxa1 family membrane protein insertase